MKFFFKHILRISAFYLVKQKSFILKRNMIQAVVNIKIKKLCLLTQFLVKELETPNNIYKNKCANPCTILMPSAFPKLTLSAPVQNYVCPLCGNTKFLSFMHYVHYDCPLQHLCRMEKQRVSSCGKMTRGS